MVRRGRAGNVSLAHDIVAENARANGFVAGAPDLAKDMRTARERPDRPRSGLLFSVGNKIVARLAWHRTQTGSYRMPRLRGGGWRSLVPAAWRFECGNIVEIPAIQDQLPCYSRPEYPGTRVCAVQSAPGGPACAEGGGIPRP